MDLLRSLLSYLTNINLHQLHLRIIKISGLQ